MNARTARSAVATLVVIVLLAGIGAVVLRPDDGPGPDQAQLRVDGAVTVTRADGTTEVTGGDLVVDFGDTVAVDEGSVVLELAAGQQYELRAGNVDSEMVVGAPPTLVAGDALVAGGFPASITVGTATLSAQGASKVDAAIPQVAAYAGRTRINGAGDLDHVLGLRQVVLTSSAAPEPFRYDPSDAWDRRFLGAAIEFGRRLEALARGYTGDVEAGRGRSESFFESVIPALAEEREFTADLLDPERAPGETLVGAAIAAQGRTGTFRERWQATFAFRDAGAEWGLVALDQGVSSAPVLETIELAIDGSPLSTTTSSTTTSTTGPSPIDTPDDPGTTTTSVTSTTTTTTTTTTTLPGGGMLDPPDDDPVDDLLDGVLRTLGVPTGLPSG